VGVIKPWIELHKERAMIDYNQLPSRDESGNIHVVIEVPRGSGVKLKFDAKLGAFVLSRTLLLGVVYPFDWGFVPSTQAPDGDPLDAMVIHESSTWPGVVIPCKPIGVIRVSQVSHKEKNAKRKQNDRIIAVPANDPKYKHVHDLPLHMRQELERFFLAATQMTQKDVTIEGWENAETAEGIINAARAAFKTPETA
jgi:inorganic pyrophosphatase